ncbi:uncharacterized protein LOC111335582 [Stylophora pistillata]|uniref:uncharacterized protein LOC111335582 n=1 Tax=Stylophora pistillata TaxID=50429 RepID=UPI000C04CC2A|nr:uncharacterized protein LOC111335582 [Stylophora pistillata]
MLSSPKSPQSQRSLDTEEVFERFKSYLDQKVESLASSLVSQTSSGTQKLERAAEAGKLKFQGNKDQFLFNSELQGTLDDSAHFLAARDVEKAGEKVEELQKSLRHRQNIIKLARKSEAGWLAVKEYQTEELANDSEDEKRIEKSQERALKQKKQNAFKRTEEARNSSNAPSSRSCDDMRLFRGMLIALSLIFSVAGKCSHSACLIVCVYLYASAFWRRKIFFLRTNVVRE